ncbi:uncharacterized protein LOC111262230 isoform X2 [Varroa jacobsoni]|uniref:uncharacterized protein LOC111262230 isoform X2 n=1 Tax=Varroa jacobsoni TaxID=62625 RepID=UPI000BF8C684|nr:uncharacterized protein LOC111262230 isoform X2 [Varroa jacobsoni]
MLSFTAPFRHQELRFPSRHFRANAPETEKPRPGPQRDSPDTSPIGMTPVQLLATNVALWALVGAQFPFKVPSQSSGNFGNKFQPFTNFDQYARNSPTTKSDFGHGTTAQSNSNGNYEVSQSLNEVSKGFPATKPDFQTPRYQLIRDQPALYQRFTFRAPTPSTPVARYQAPVQQYESARFQYPTVPPQYRFQTFQPRPIANVRPYKPPPTSQPYQVPLVFLPQNQSSARQRYQFPPRQYQPPSQQYQPPPQKYQPLQQQQQPPEPQRPRNGFVGTVRLPFDAAVLAVRSYSPPRQTSSSDSSQQTKKKPAIFHRPAHVHHVRVKAKPEGDYKFGYDTAKSPNEDESFRRETRGPNGTVRGSYSNADSNGKQIIVHNDGLNKVFKTLLGNEANSKRTQAVGGQNNFGDGRAQAQGGLHMQVISRPDQDIAVQQSALRITPDAPLIKGPSQPLPKRRQQRAVTNDANDDEDNDELKPQRNFGLRVVTSGSLRPTGSPRPNRLRIRRPINIDGSSLRLTPRPGSFGNDSSRPPVRQRQLARTRVVIRTTTPLPAAFTPRPTAPRRRVIPPSDSTSPTFKDVIAFPPEQKRRRKVKRKFRTTVAPVLQNQPLVLNELVQTRTPVVPERAPVLPPLRPAPIAPLKGSMPASVFPEPVTPSSQISTQIQRPQQIPPPTLIQQQSPIVSQFNHPLNNPFAQHVRSPQSLYDQLTNSIYQEARRVPIEKHFPPHQQQIDSQYVPEQQRTFRFQHTPPSQFSYHTQYGVSGQFPIAQGFQTPQFSSPYQQGSRFQQASYQLPRQQTQPSTNQDLFPYATNQRFSHPALLSYDIGSAQRL